MDAEASDACRRVRGVGGCEELGLAAAETGCSVDSVEDGVGRESEVTGRSGNVAEGAGLGDGILRKDSLDVLRRAGTIGTARTTIVMGFSVRLQWGREKGVVVTVNDFTSVHVQLVDFVNLG